MKTFVSSHFVSDCSISFIEAAEIALRQIFDIYGQNTYPTWQNDKEQCQIKPSWMCRSINGRFINSKIRMNSQIRIYFKTIVIKSIVVFDGYDDISDNVSNRYYNTSNKNYILEGQQ